MRTFFTSLWAFLLSAFAGGMIVQIVAEQTNATEEFILAFMAIALVAIVVAIVFFIAQLSPNPVAAVAMAGKALSALVILGGVSLLVWSFWADGLQTPDVKEGWLLFALTVPALVTVFVHWQFVRWRLRRNEPHLGRGAVT